MEERARCRRRQLSSKISGLSGLLSISSTLSLVLLVFPRPSKGSVWESTQTHVGAGTRALLGPRASASRRRALRGAAQGGADVVSRFPLLAPEACCGALRTQIAKLGIWRAGPDERGALIQFGQDSESRTLHLSAAAALPSKESASLIDHRRGPCLFVPRQQIPVRF